MRQDFVFVDFARSLLIFFPRQTCLRGMTRQGHSTGSWMASKVVSASFTIPGRGLNCWMELVGCDLATYLGLQRCVNKIRKRAGEDEGPDVISPEITYEQPRYQSVTHHFSSANCIQGPRPQASAFAPVRSTRVEHAPMRSPASAGDNIYVIIQIILH